MAGPGFRSAGHIYDVIIALLNLELEFLTVYASLYHTVPFTRLEMAAKSIRTTKNRL